MGVWAVASWDRKPQSGFGIWFGQPTGTCSRMIGGIESSGMSSSQSWITLPAGRNEVAEVAEVVVPILWARARAQTVDYVEDDSVTDAGAGGGGW